MSKKTIITVTGIRPDFIRMSEIFRCLDEDKDINHILIHTGQHYDKLLSDVFFDDLDIRKPDYNLSVGAAGRAHYYQQAALGPKMIETIEENNLNPDIILFLGDSNSILASVPLKKEGYKIGHIEAAMRSYDERMLEEINRKVCDHVSDILFVYHDNYKQKALREGIPENRIHVIGNTIVEPLLKLAENTPKSNKHILLDIHRPENFKYRDRMEKILNYANSCIREFQIPVKMLLFNRTIKAIEDYKLNLGDIELIPLMGYKDFIKFQQECKFIISDSGTAQEEPALLHIPVVVPRDVTERPESVENNCSFMLSLAAQDHLTTSFKWLSSKKPNSIEWLGDGTTSHRVLTVLKTALR